MAAFAPLSLLAIFYVAMLLDQSAREAEERTMDRARSYVDEVDAALERDLGALSLLARSREIFTRRGDDAWFRNALVDFPQWREIVVSEPGAGTTSHFVAAALTGPDIADPAELVFASAPMDNYISGVDRARYGCICVAVQVRHPGVTLTLLRDVADFYASLSKQAGPGEVAALVDRDGRFVARSLDNAARAGNLASTYLRAAIASGEGGVYDGVTLEGLSNRSAFATSALTGWSAHIAVPAFTYRLLSTGYLVFAFAALGVALAFAGGVTWFGLRDLRLARQRERARLQAYKLESVGALSSAIVHDFNNLLSIMNACLSILSTTENPEKREYAAREGLLASDRGAKLVKQLLAFVRDKPPEIVCIDLLATIEGVGDLIARSLTPQVRFSFDIAPDARFVLTSRSQFELVLLNFATNARDAMPEGGEFTISSRRAAASGRVDVVIRDNGPGMAKEVAARAFEPFFTTKPEGKGTGLGLAQAQLLASDSDAPLTLETQPGKGCAFTYSFRACAPE